MKNTVYFAALAGVLSFTGCLNPRLAQHNRAYDLAGKSTTVQNHFATTKEELVAVWGKNQTYYCDSSDLEFHYIVHYHDMWLKRKYRYRIPSTTKFATMKPVATQVSLPQRFEVSFQ